MRESMETVLNDLWLSRDNGLPFKSSREAIILASIVEKETGIAEERAHVASVFINRLRIGMRLQSDPTVGYGISNNGRFLPKSLTKGDLKRATPFNTYIIHGLPPGPITNPGVDSIKAVLHPLLSKDLYFVADGTGGHAFAETLQDHNKNVREWRAIKQSLSKN